MLNDCLRQFVLYFAKNILLLSVLHFGVGLPAVPLHFFFVASNVSNVRKFFDGAVWNLAAAVAAAVMIPSSSSCDDMVESSQQELGDSKDDEDRSNDDLIAGDVEKAQEKQKSFGAELQRHNYFSSLAKHHQLKKRSTLQKTRVYPMLCI
jgi:hypothetical protein